MPGKIFINYRRDDSAGTAGRLHDSFFKEFGSDNLFMDVHIPAGIDFVDYLNSQVASCEIFLVVIGPNWLAATDGSGRSRIHDPSDFVAVEIAAALSREIRVIPVLVDGARMPQAGELPQQLKALARRQAVEVRNTQFHRDCHALVERVREALSDGRRVSEGAVSIKSPVEPPRPDAPAGAVEKMHLALADDRWDWRFVTTLAGKAAVDYDQALTLLRSDPEVELGTTRAGVAKARLRRRRSP